MDATVARDIALTGHRRGRDRHGELIIEHVARVASSVPDEARPAAWLHDVLEKSTVTVGELLERGLTTTECEALKLLTRDPDEPYESYALRIAYADGDAGRLARMIKLADLDDHIGRHTWAPGDPPYGWARRHIECATARTAAAQIG